MATNFNQLNTAHLKAAPHPTALCQQNSNLMLIWDYHKLHFPFAHSLKLSIIRHGYIFSKRAALGWGISLFSQVQRIVNSILYFLNMEV